MHGTERAAAYGIVAAVLLALLAFFGLTRRGGDRPPLRDLEIRLLASCARTQQLGCRG
jgi:hypothetical protein